MSGVFLGLVLGIDKEIFGEVFFLFYGEYKFGLFSLYDKCWVNCVGKWSVGCIWVIVIYCEGNVNYVKSYFIEM